MLRTYFRIIAVPAEMLPVRFDSIRRLHYSSMLCYAIHTMLSRSSSIGEMFWGSQKAWNVAVHTKLLEPCSSLSTEMPEFIISLCLLLIWTLRSQISEHHQHGRHKRVPSFFLSVTF
jgi:hypothetical protein